MRLPVQCAGRVPTVGLQGLILDNVNSCSSYSDDPGFMVIDHDPALFLEVRYNAPRFFRICAYVCSDRVTVDKLVHAAIDFIVKHLQKLLAPLATLLHSFAVHKPGK